MHLTSGVAWTLRIPALPRLDVEAERSVSGGKVPGPLFPDFLLSDPFHGSSVRLSAAKSPATHQGRRGHGAYAQNDAFTASTIFAA